MAELYTPNLKHPAPANIGRSTPQSGDGAPSNDDGNDGDTYVNRLSGALYTKSGGSWTQNS